MNGLEWKRSRSLFNSGFSAGYILQQTSHVVDEAEVYVDIFREHARKGKMFSLDGVTCWYMMDVIGAVALDSQLHSQQQFNPLASALRRQTPMTKLRAEHDAVFGADITETANTMREQPHLLNRLPYTTAVIKESLRLFPPASAMRGGQPGVYLQDDKGNRYPTEGTNM
ncbi:cytochrome P450 [Daldinia vernicosa]|uniref:cytochrome P450 n=1 Tax=Daldinia vernicosa TaxID=114800 RepID=UPI002008A71F|nr:cytochrome P450 [Daldinia vernicosa]KAI0848483.1 cytochrome P450 [Daldinia vernicosa]